MVGGGGEHKDDNNAIKEVERFMLDALLGARLVTNGTLKATLFKCKLRCVLGVKSVMYSHQTLLHHRSNII